MGNMEVIKLIDTTRCTACRGCQVACKQWNELPGLRTKNLGTYQNPPDLQWNTWTLIRFQEYVNTKGEFKWMFRKDGCMHCTDAACVKVCPSGALSQTDFGTVGLKKHLCIGCKNCIAACPFEIPRYNKATDKASKCDLCLTRIQSNRRPACVKSCPTGALSIGPKEQMLKAAYERVKTLGDEANVYGDNFVGGTHVVYVLSEKPAAYDKLPVNPTVPSSIMVWKDWLKPLSLIAGGGVIAGSLLHYILHGPKRPDDNGNQDKAVEGGK
jgi:formate dehydrogenase beta subunit